MMMGIRGGCDCARRRLARPLDRRGRSSEWRGRPAGRHPNTGPLRARPRHDSEPQLTPVAEDHEDGRRARSSSPRGPEPDRAESAEGARAAEAIRYPGRLRNGPPVSGSAQGPGWGRLSVA